MTVKQTSDLTLAQYIVRAAKECRTLAAAHQTLKETRIENYPYVRVLLRRSRTDIRHMRSNYQGQDPILDMLMDRAIQKVNELENIT